MAITGGAALIGGIATGTGAVAASTVVIAGLAISAVGLITGNKLLSQVGGGLGLGAGVGGLASGIGSSATGATDLTGNAIDASSVADASGAGSQAAGDVAATFSPVTGSGAPLGFDSASATGGLDASTGLGSSGADMAGSAASGGGDAVVDPSVAAATDPAAANSISSNLAADASPAADAAPTTAPVVPGTAQAPAGSINANLAQTSSVAPGAQSPDADAATVPGNSVIAGNTGSGAPLGYSTPSLNAGTLTGTGNGLQPPTSFFGSLLNNVSNWWTGLDPKTQTVFGQTAMGLASGLGQGALSMISESQKLKLAQEQQDFQHANLSGASSIPTFNATPNPAANPYVSGVAAPMYSGPTPNVAIAQPGLINTAKG